MSSDTSRGAVPGITQGGRRSPEECPSAPSPVIRRATPADIDAIFAIGTAEPAFGVSSAIRFYERCELEEWIAAPQENILLVLEDEGKIAGFLFCKIMSSHWAYLDNFYLRPGNRGRGYGRLFMEALLSQLKCQGIAYLSTLIDKEDTFLTGYVKTYGLESEKTYVWLERFVD